MLQAQIALVDKTKRIRPAHLSQVANAITTQINRDLAKYWPVSGTVTTLEDGEAIPPSVWPVYIVDSLPDGEGGYHWMDGRNQPYAEVLNIAGWTNATSHEVCLTGDTKISLLDGTNVAIRDLVGRSEFYVYSCKESGDIRPGRGHSARITKMNAPIVKVTLDNGESIRCTADHPFMMRDGSYVEAGKLSAGSSLMPLYRQRAVLDPKKARKGMTDYEQVWNPSTQEWIYTHRMAVPYCSNGYVRHHRDFNRFNNSPSNIQVMTWEDHQKLHAEHIAHYGRLGRGKKKNVASEHRAAAAARGRKNFLAYNGSEKHLADMAAYYAIPGMCEKHGKNMRPWAMSEENVRRLAEMNRTPEARARAAASITSYNVSEAHREAARGVGKKAMELLWSNPDFVERKSTISSEVAKRLNSDPVFQAFAHHRRWHAKRGVFNPDCMHCANGVQPLPAAANNHKVVSIEPCGHEDVYDITVDKYHNFALSSGVFVHNCEMLVDPYGNRLQTAAQIKLDGGKITAGDGQESYLVEIADPVEAHGYLIDGVGVSDFITPAYYQSGSSGPYDYMGRLKRPMDILFGGYISYIDPNTNDMLQILWLDQGQPPQLVNLGPATGKASLKDHVDSKTGSMKKLLTSGMLGQNPHNL